VDLPPDMVERLRAQAENFSEQDLLALIDRSGIHFERIHRSTQPRILLEASVVEYCRFESRVLLSELARRLGALGGGPALQSGGSNGTSKAAPAAKRTITRPAASRSGDQAGSQSGGSQSGGSQSGGSQSGGRQSGGRQSGAAATPVAKPTYVSPSPLPKPAAAVVPPTSGTPDMTEADRAVPGWTRLIDDLMQKYPRLGSCLMSGLPALSDSGQLTVHFAEDKKFAVNSIANECEKIADVASALWNKTISVELVLGTKGQKDAVKEEIRQEVAPTHREELAKACADDAALGDLVDLMGGGKPLLENEDGQ